MEEEPGCRWVRRVIRSGWTLGADRADLFSDTTDSDPVVASSPGWLVWHVRGTRRTKAAVDPSQVKDAIQGGSDSRNGTNGRHRNDVLTGRGVPRPTLSLFHADPSFRQP